MTKKLLALFLALVLCVGVFAACGNNNNDDTGSGSGTGNGVVSGPYVTPDFDGAKITQYMPNNTQINPNETWLNGEVKKHLDLDLDIIEGADLTGMIATGKVPDLQWFNSFSTVGMQQNGRDGVYINIYDYLDQMPNLKKFLEDPANAAHVEKFTVGEREMYNVPVVEKGGNAQKYAFLYRKDIFDKNNLTWPTNQAEFVAVLKELKRIYPESMPFAMRQMTSNMQGAQAFGHLWGGVHLLRGEYTSVFTLDANGKYYLGTTSQAYKEMAMFMKDLLDQGLMHASSLTLDTTQWTSAFSSNTSFITYDKVDQLNGLNTSGKQLNDASFQMVAGAPFNFGTYATTATTVSTSFASAGTKYSYAIGNGKNVQNVIKYVDWLYSEEGQMMTNWGVKDVSYVESAEGVKTFKEGFLESKGGLIQAGLWATCMSGCTDMVAYRASCNADLAAALELAEKYEGGTPAQVPLYFGDADNALWPTYAKAFETYTRGELTKFISGQRDFSTWDNVIQELKDNYQYDWLLKLHEDTLASIKGK